MGTWILTMNDNDKWNWHWDGAEHVKFMWVIAANCLTIVCDDGEMVPEK
jgi:hypothetical protein